MLTGCFIQKKKKMMKRKDATSKLKFLNKQGMFEVK